MGWDGMVVVVGGVVGIAFGIVQIDHTSAEERLLRNELCSLSVISAGMLQLQRERGREKKITPTPPHHTPPTTTTVRRSANRRLADVLVFTWRPRLGFTLELDLLRDRSNCLDR